MSHAAVIACRLLEDEDFDVRDYLSSMGPKDAGLAQIAPDTHVELYPVKGGYVKIASSKWPDYGNAWLVRVECLDASKQVTNSQKCWFDSENQAFTRVLNVQDYIESNAQNWTEFNSRQITSVLTD